MAVLIASNLRKELSGGPLFDGVSFKVERRDRVALSGPNGVGKTTLLRALVGETSLQGGELALQKSSRVALHDQRPPLELGLTLREYVLSGARDLIAFEQELRRLEESMANGDHGPSVTNAVLELGGGRSLYFSGPWHAWRREKAARAAAAATTAERVGEDIARLERFVERFRAKKEKAKQAQAKLTQIARLEKERSVATGELQRLSAKRHSLGFEFLKPSRSGRTVVEASGLAVEIGGRALLEDATFALERGEHVALVGPNGSGKTTLLETILGRREQNGGSVRLGHGVVPAYFSQQEAELDTRGSVLQCVQRATGLQRPDAQKLLGRFLFSGWSEHEKPVLVLSGGERRRLALALVVASGANFLVLDEPTNHLDLESREALEAALEAFPGTILLVSHDRALLDAVAER